ncbi:MAG: hypothetical protein RJB01_221 [Actinomycetota bacterium]|jgi:hypothetical protein
MTSLAERGCRSDIVPIDNITKQSLVRSIAPEREARREVHRNLKGGCYSMRHRGQLFHSTIVQTAPWSGDLSVMTTFSSAHPDIGLVHAVLATMPRDVQVFSTMFRFGTRDAAKRVLRRQFLV